jgi:hypothetical protein
MIAGSEIPNPSSPAQNTQASVWMPQTSQLWNLNPIFGWTTGVATYINNFSWINGYSPQTISYSTFGSPALKQIYALTDNQVIVGADAAGGVVYICCDTTTHFPGVDISHAFNTSGQVLATWPHLGQLYTPRVGYEQQPAQPGFNVVSFNELGQFVGNTPGPSGTSVAGLYEAGGTLQPIDSLLPPGSGWTVNQAVAINNTGQILVIATKAGRTTGLLLTPESSAPVSAKLQTSPLFRARQVTVPAAEADEVPCESLFFNGRRSCSPMHNPGTVRGR